MEVAGTNAVGKEYIIFNTLLLNHTVKHTILVINKIRYIKLIYVQEKIYMADTIEVVGHRFEPHDIEIISDSTL